MPDCSCKKCRSACAADVGKPGRFLPDELEKAAAFKGLSVQEFFNTYCGVEGPLHDHEDVFFWITPAIVTMQPGAEYPAYPRGQCIFYKDDKCEIHIVKPYECRETLCCAEDDVLLSEKRQDVLTTHWNLIEPQRLVRKLLGRAPAPWPITETDWQKFRAWRRLQLEAQLMHELEKASVLLANHLMQKAVES